MIRKRVDKFSREVEEIHPSDVMSVSASSDYTWPACWIARPENTLETDETRMWNSRSFGPAWIRFDLGPSEPYVSRIDLLPSMHPASARVTHLVRMGKQPDLMETVMTFEGECTDRKWMVCRFVESHKRARYVEIYTPQSPSWVAWIQIRFWKKV